MTVYTEVLPIGTIAGIVEGVAVLMVDRKEVFIFVVKLPGTFGADQAVELERFFPVVAVIPVLHFDCGVIVMLDVLRAAFLL